jgi:hypothetical protein
MWPPGYEPIDPAHVRRHPPWRLCFYASLLGVLFLVWRYSSYDCGFGHLLHGRPTPLTDAKLTLTESHVFHGWSPLKAAGVAEILRRELPKMAPQQPLPPPQLDEDAVIEFWNQKFATKDSAVLTDPDNADSDPGVVSQIVDKVAFLKLWEGKKVGDVLG